MSKLSIASAITLVTSTLKDVQVTEANRTLVEQLKADKLNLVNYTKKKAPTVADTKNAQSQVTQIIYRTKAISIYADAVEAMHNKGIDCNVIKRNSSGKYFGFTYFIETGTLPLHKFQGDYTQASYAKQFIDYLISNDKVESDLTMTLGEIALQLGKNPIPASVKAIPAKSGAIDFYGVGVTQAASVIQVLRELKLVECDKRSNGAWYDKPFILKANSKFVERINQLA